MTSCIVCGNACTKEIYPDFALCDKCNVAMRTKYSIKQDKKEIYRGKWVNKHNESVIANGKADYIVNYIKHMLNPKYIEDIKHYIKILDVGCGSGLLVDKLNKFGFNADGIDFMEEAISFCKENRQGNFILGDADLSAINGEQIYDVIIAAHLIEHLENPNLFLSGVNRLLKSDGYLYISCPNLLWYNNESRFRNGLLQFDPDHVVSYSKEGLSKLLDKDGFTLLDIHTKTHRLEILSGLASNIYRGGKQDIQSSDSVKTIYQRITDLPLMPWMMYIPNRLSEHNDKGSELVIVAQK